MLKQIRGTLKRVGAWIVVPLVVLGFIFVGVPEVRQLASNHAVKVGGEGFSALTVQREFDRYATNRRLSGDESFDRAQAIELGVPNQIVQSLATRAALDQEAGRMGLLVPRSAVREFLQSNEQFKNPRTGKFDNEVLTNIMREYNYGVREFEDRLQSDLLRNQLTSALNAAGGAPKAFIDSLVLRETEQRTISYLTVTSDMAGDASEETPEALKKYYEDNASQFMAPEYRTFTTVILKDADFAETESISEDELKKIYDATKARYETPEKRSLYQLTFDDEAKAKAAADALKSGQPFETIADGEGKTLASVTLTDIEKRDLLDPKVAEGAFKATEAGAVVGPIEGVFGYTIAQLISISPASVRSFDDVRSEIEADAQSKDIKKKLFEAIDEIENARDTGASLADAAKSADAVAIEYGPVDSYSFGAGGEIVADIPADVLKEAFRLDEGEESDAIELDDKSGYFFVVVSEVRPPAVIPYEEVADEVATRWRAADRDSHIAKAVKSVRDAIDAGKSLKEASEILNRAPITERVTRRTQSQALSQPVLEQVFAASKGETISGPAAIGDAQVIVSVDDIAYDLSAVSSDDIAAFSQYVGNQMGQELVDAYSGAVVADAKPKINQAQIDAIFAETQ
ncbi:MAG: peptidyl-prolyl cis-trans isomerase [Parvularculaceae bacterium]